ncbi:MAG: HD domain-containing protein [Desulfovibrionaceae bacterium]|nr:HD domain-containing protein [Desulfovibrionaceae bacterium]
MRTLRKSLLQFVFSGSSMRRWNDKLRPVELYEVDKQAHKMICAFFLYQLQCRRMDMDAALVLGRKIVEGALFDYLYRLVITDIKPPVFYRIKENPEHYRQLTGWVLGELEPVVRPMDEGFWQRLAHYHRRPGALRPEDGTDGAKGLFPAPGGPDLADRILRAAHLYASKWEFNLIRPLNAFDEEMGDIERSFDEELRELADLAGVPELLAGSGNALVRAANLCGQLRFQIRWSQTPRVPETSVLGHMFVVAAYAYFLSLSLGACEMRCINNFFCGLFHDVPELLTRDIITPVKRSVEQLPGIIHQYEDEALRCRMLRPLAEAGYGDIAERMSYYLGLEAGSEFAETLRDPSDRSTGAVRCLESFEALHRIGNDNRLDPKDGQLVKVCDTLAAFIEARTSVYNGVSSPPLYEAMSRIRAEYRHQSLGDFNVGTLLADFD